MVGSMTTDLLLLLLTVAGKIAVVALIVVGVLVVFVFAMACLIWTRDRFFPSFRQGHED